MSKLFGTDGIRARAGEFPLDDETIRRIGAAFARVFEEKLGRPPRFVSGRDTRESGGHIEMLIHNAASALGAAGESAGVITTPGVAFLTLEFDFDAGVVISASHNPYEDNGIKFFLPSGHKLSSADEEAIENLVNSGPAVKPSEEKRLDVVRESSFLDRYLDHFSEKLPDLDLSNYKIVIDCANGAASNLAPKLFGRFGANVVTINNSPDGRNINKDCGSLHLESLREKVVEQKADFGVAFDGDADRSLFANEKGEIVDGDATLWILANDLKNRGELRSNKVIATVMSNIGLEAALRNESIELVRTPVGDKYVLESLLETGAEVGGEQSGHIIIPANGLVGDGMMTALSVLNVMASSGKSLSALTTGFRTYPQILVNVRVNEKRPFESVPEIAAAARKLEQALSNDGRLLLRYSGTENLARVMIEGKDQARIEVQANELADLIGRVLG